MGIIKCYHINCLTTLASDFMKLLSLYLHWLIKPRWTLQMHCGKCMWLNSKCDQVLICNKQTSKKVWEFESQGSIRICDLFFCARSNVTISVLQNLTGVTKVYFLLFNIVRKLWRNRGWHENVRKKWNLWHGFINNQKWSLEKWNCKHYYREWVRQVP